MGWHMAGKKAVKGEESPAKNGERERSLVVSLYR